MDSVLNFNDISIYSGREIQDIYNETVMGIFMAEASYFQDIMNKRSSGILTESVFLEAEESGLKIFKDKVKEFFKKIKDGIIGFFKKIIDGIKSLGRKKQEEILIKDLEETEKEIQQDSTNEKKELTDSQKEKLSKLDWYDDFGSTLEKMAMNDLKFYRDKLDKFYNNQTVKDIINTVKIEAKANRRKAHENPQWTTVTHTDRSILSVNGVHENLPIEEFIHLYDKAILDIEEYIPKNNKYSVKSKENSDVKYRYVNRFNKEKMFKNGVSEFEIDAIKFAHELGDILTTKGSDNIRVKVIKSQYNDMMRDAKKFENDLIEIKNLSTDSAQCVSKIMSLISKTTKEGFKCVTDFVNAENYMYNYNVHAIRRINSILKRADN
jgi:hypothetical protein